jgi:hypothetical protein
MDFMKTEVEECDTRMRGPDTGQKNPEYEALYIL